MPPYYNKGTHRVRILSQGFPDANEYGQQFVIKVLVLGQAAEYERPVFLSLTNADGQASDYSNKTMEVLKYLGFHGEDASLARLDPDHIDHYSFVGIECVGYCKHKTKTNEETGETKTFENWYINTPRSGGVEYGKPDSMALKKLDSLFGKELKQSPPTTIQDSPPPKNKPVDVNNAAAETEAARQDQEIPF